MSEPHRKRLKRRETEGDVRFLTFSCYHRLQLFSSDAIRDAFAAHLADAKARLGFRLFAWVVMPEHVHLLLLPPLPERSVVSIMHHLKRRFAERVIRRWKELGAPILSRITDDRGIVHFWQAGGGYDRNIFTQDEFFEKRDYIHRNPVTRGLVLDPEAYRWSSAWKHSNPSAALVPIDPSP